jgi:phage gp16-like protein
MTALLKTIHVGCRQLGLDEDTRRDLQLVATGKASLKEMTPAEQQLVLDALKARGFKTGPASGKNKGFRNPASRGDVRFCHVLWGKLVQAGAVQVPGATGLNAFIRARFEKAWGAVPLDIDGLRDWQQIAAVIEALKGMCNRAGVDVK